MGYRRSGESNGAGDTDSINDELSQASSDFSDAPF
jgi:hypothetical protein